MKTVLEPPQPQILPTQRLGSSPRRLGVGTELNIIFLLVSKKINKDKINQSYLRG
jgi:hypothetical protein